MGNHYDRLKDGTLVEMVEIQEDDYNKYCVRAIKEIWVDFKNNTVKPCYFNEGVQVDDYDKFFQLIEDINNNVTRTECNYCNNNMDPYFRISGNKMWLTPHHGNSHVEFYIDKTFNKDALEKYVKIVAKDHNKFACMCIRADEPGKTIIEQNHIELIAKPFFAENKLVNRNLRYDFITDLDFSLQRTYLIIKYFEKMKKKYPNVYVNIQPQEVSLKNDFDKKIDLFVDAGYEIVARSKATKTRLESRYKNHKTIKLTIQLV